VVRSGTLRNRVQLQSRATTVDAAGQHTGTWSTYRTCYAEVIDKGGAEKIRGQQVDATVSHVVRIRYPQGTFPTPENRVVYDSRNLHIESVQRRDTHEREVWLYCREDV
jgi:SPP1 family predicted phage head-tail adaptor